MMQGGAAEVGDEEVKEEKEEQIMTLDDILANEGLLKKEQSRLKQLLKRGVQKIKMLTTERHFTDSRIQVDLKGFSI